MRAARRFLARPLSGLAVVLALSACDPATTGDMFKSPQQIQAEQQAAAQAAAAKRKAEEDARLAVFRKPVPLPLDGNGEPIIEVASSAPAPGAATPALFGPAPATAAPVLGGDVPTKLSLSGAAWSATIDGKTLKITSPEAPKGRSIEVRRTGYLGGSDYTGSLGTDKGLRLNVSRKVCSSGAGISMAYTAKLVIGETTYTGCAAAVGGV